MSWPEDLVLETQPRFRVEPGSGRLACIFPDSMPFYPAPKIVGHSAISTCMGRVSLAFSDRAHAAGWHSPPLPSPHETNLQMPGVKEAVLFLLGGDRVVDAFPHF